MDIQFCIVTFSEVYSVFIYIKIFSPGECILIFIYFITLLFIFVLLVFRARGRIHMMRDFAMLVLSVAAGSRGGSLWVNFPARRKQVSTGKAVTLGAPMTEEEV